MMYFFGLFLGAYAPLSFAGLMPDYVHVVLLMMAWLSLGYVKELAAPDRGMEGTEAEPLSQNEAVVVRMRFEQARRAEALRRELWPAWQQAMPQWAKAA
jgi:hypothetical protein